MDLLIHGLEWGQENNMEDKRYPADYFDLVQENERLLDKPLQSKRLTYFQDAMIRFTKNKYNVIATIVLTIMIIMSIIVPIITPDRFIKDQNSELQTLPPRVPLLEKLGIFDGMNKYKDQPIDYRTIDPETGLGYPTVGFDVEFIQMDTLKNYEIYGAERDPLYVGGTNDLFINSGMIAYSFITTQTYAFFTDMSITVDVAAIDPAGVLEVYSTHTNDRTQLASWDDLTLLDTINTSGVHTINPLDTLTAGDYGFLVFKYVLPQESSQGKEFVSLNSFTINYPNPEDNVVYEGYDLAMLPLFTVNNNNENGRFLRNNAVMVVASFKYDEYGALFSDKIETLGAEEYLRTLEENPGMAESIVLDPNDPDEAWTFGEGYPYMAVLSVDSKVIAGKEYTNYSVLVDGAYSLGFEDTPYFAFGTDVFGKDLFAIIWLGLRTSLLLGFLATLTNTILGIVWGATSAYYGGQVDILMERFTDIWGSFPQITMIGIITVIVGPGFMALYIFVVYDGWIGAAKITRTQFYRYKGREYVLAARTLGASDSRIIFKHILPNALGTIVTRVILGIPSIVFLEVNLSYLGFGIGNGQKLIIGPLELTGTSIGVILNDGQQQIFAGSYWLIIWPTVIISILMITFNMFGNALRDALNPQLRGN